MPVSSIGHFIIIVLLYLQSEHSTAQQVKECSSRKSMKHFCETLIIQVFSFLLVLIECRINDFLVSNITQLQCWKQGSSSHQVFIPAWQSLPILTSNQEHRSNIRNMTTEQNEKSHNNFSTKRTREQIIELIIFDLLLWQLG